jgi:hypothetical protein
MEKMTFFTNKAYVRVGTYLENMGDVRRVCGHFVVELSTSNLDIFKKHVDVLQVSNNIRRMGDTYFNKNLAFFQNDFTILVLSNGWE